MLASSLGILVKVACVTATAFRQKQFLTQSKFLQCCRISMILTSTTNKIYVLDQLIVHLFDMFSTNRILISSTKLHFKVPGFFYSPFI